MADDSIHMSVVQIGKRKLRFLEWATTDDTISNSQEQKDNIPLFLGADVLSGCSIAVSNLPRMHAKFSKQGLAVKVNFPNSLDCMASMALLVVFGSTQFKAFSEFALSITIARNN